MVTVAFDPTLIPEPAKAKARDQAAATRTSPTTPSRPTRRTPSSRRGEGRRGEGERDKADHEKKVADGQKKSRTWPTGSPPGTT